MSQPTLWVGFGPVAMPVHARALRRDLEREMERALAAARDEIPAAVSVTTQLLHGRPAAMLAALAESGGYDLIVVGPRRAGRLRRLVHRSVTHGLLARSNVSVLAVKPS